MKILKLFHLNVIRFKYHTEYFKMNALEACSLLDYSYLIKGNKLSATRIYSLYINYFLFNRATIIGY